MARRARVLVTQETSADFSGAEAWGEVRFITNKDFHNMEGSLQNKEVLDAIAVALEDFDENLDWVVIAGSPYVSAMVMYMIGQRGGGPCVQFLRWDNRDRMYRPLRLNGLYHYI